MKFFDILLPVGTDGVYTYKAPYDIQPGQRVYVPFGRRKATGICLNETTAPEFECREIDYSLDEFPLFPPLWMDLIKWISDYYVAPLGTTLHGVISQKLLSSMPPEKPFIAETTGAKNIQLSTEQREVVEEISMEGYSAHLLQGITGSGKTEIYLELIKRCIESGKQALYLVPEISLTPQLVERLEARLGFKPLVYHSKLTDKRRSESFWYFAQGKHPLLLGARSALFVPSSNLGLIIVDEEHENTFKQEEAPSYHLRDMAVLYAKMSNIPIVLGSATPQVESIENARSGKYRIHYLRQRHGGAILPDIELVDMRKETLVGDVLAESVYDKLYAAVKTGKQAIIFLNRKGYATALFCKRCGKIHECVNCSVPLTMYKSSGRSSCHYCGELYPTLTCCECACEEIFDAGAGTERVEEFLLEMFPGNVLRIDAGKINTFKQLDKALDSFYKKEAQILVGTQLIAKGLHFPDVTFVGILGIDNILAIPDFRSVEKAYQLVMQVSGRAGRGEAEGKVYIQTQRPENEVFQYFSKDPDEFYTYELGRREAFHYPPFTKTARIIFSYSKQAEIRRMAEQTAARLSAMAGSNAEILGPAPAIIYKIKNQYRFSIIIKCRSGKLLTELLHTARNSFEAAKTGSMGIKIDRDPYFFM